MKKRSNSGQFAAGNSGRPKGSKNLKTIQWEQFGVSMIEGNLPWMQKRIEELKSKDPDRAFDLLLHVFEFFKPKLSRVAHEAGGDSKEVTITHRIINSREDLLNEGRS